MSLSSLGPDSSGGGSASLGKDGERSGVIFGIGQSFLRLMEFRTTLSL
jgi:hypothetical protein